MKTIIMHKNNANKYSMFYFIFAFMLILCIKPDGHRKLLLQYKVTDLASYSVITMYTLYPGNVLLIAILIPNFWDSEYVLT